jgi:tRNA-2-methylthio-N6-dimethylallyladenosine synthase
MEDDVPEEPKHEDCKKLSIYNKTCLVSLSEFIGQTVEVLVEKVSKKSTKNFQEEIAKYYGGFFQRRIIKLGIL